MRLKALRPTALMLVALIAPGTARAGTITYAEWQAAGGARQYRPASEVRLRVAPQSGLTTPAGGAQGIQSSGNSSTASNGGQTQQPNGSSIIAGSGSATAGGVTTDPTLSQSGGQVETIDLGDVTGTVCDCGEIPAIPVRGGGIGFPWWALAGIPLICVSGICFGDDDTPPFEPPGPPPPPPTPQPIPEPATLLLFGSGLLAAGAGARRRYGRKSLADSKADAEEV